jgi:hypothetical protein
LSTGGSNTDGLGGIGGPFRLDSDNPIFQVADLVKTQLLDNIRQKAREMAKRAFQQRLREIDMSEYDADAYEKFFKKIAKQSALLKVIIESLQVQNALRRSGSWNIGRDFQAKGKERQWVRHQTSGDLDDGKLIEGLTGEKAIYRRRTEKEPEPGTPMQKPKRMRICADVSGSMYRFNGYDGRLQKTLEACLMVMDSLELHADKIKVRPICICSSLLFCCCRCLSLSLSQISPLLLWRLLNDYLFSMTSSDIRGKNRMRRLCNAIVRPRTRRSDWTC